MSSNSSIRSTLHPYQRPTIWLNDPEIKLAEELRQRTAAIVDKISKADWTKRPDTWRKDNGYPE